MQLEGPATAWGEEALPGSLSEEPPADKRQQGSSNRPEGVCPISLLSLPISQEHPYGRQKNQQLAEQKCGLQSASAASQNRAWKGKFGAD